MCCNLHQVTNAKKGELKGLLLFQLLVQLMLRRFSMVFGWLMVLSAVFLLVPGCTPHESDHSAPKIEQLKDCKEVPIVVRFFPESKLSELQDTILNDPPITITIMKAYLDSFVVNEFDSEGRLYRDQYRDAAVRLTIRKQQQTISDTLFSKNSFRQLTSVDFLKSAVLQQYSFEKMSGDSLVFFGTINRPETDIAVDFYHYFDLKTCSYRLDIVPDDEE